MIGNLAIGFWSQIKKYILELLGGSNFDTSYGSLQASYIGMDKISQTKVLLSFISKEGGDTFTRGYVAVVTLDQDGIITGIGSITDVATAGGGNIIAIEVLVIDHENAVAVFDNANRPYVQLFTYDNTGLITLNGSFAYLNPRSFQASTSAISLQYISRDKFMVAFGDNPVDASIIKFVSINVDTGVVTPEDASENIFSTADRLSNVKLFLTGNNTCIVMGTIGNTTSGPCECWLFTYNEVADTFILNDSIQVTGANTRPAYSQLTETNILHIYNERGRLVTVDNIGKTLAISNEEIIYNESSSWQTNPSITSLNNGKIAAFFNSGGTGDLGNRASGISNNLSSTIVNRELFDNNPAMNYNRSLSLTQEIAINFWVSDRTASNNILGRTFKLYNGDQVQEEGPYNVNSGTNTFNFSFGGIDSQPGQIAVKSDGTAIYIAAAQNDSIYQLDLSTPWDLSTATYNNIFHDISTENSSGTCYGMHIKADGTKIWLTDTSSVVFEYDILTPWDISTMSYTNNSNSFISYGTAYGMHINPTGDKLYLILLSTPYRIVEFDIIGFDISTANLNTSYNNPGELFGRTLVVDNNNEHLYTVNTSLDRVYDIKLDGQYGFRNMYIDNFRSISSSGSPLALAFGDNGNKMFVVDSGGDLIREFTL